MGFVEDEGIAARAIGALGIFDGVDFVVIGLGHGHSWFKRGIAQYWCDCVRPS